MTNATGSQSNRPNLVLLKETNEWGQITDLDKNAQYFVIRKPTREMTREMRTQFVTDVRSFLHEHRVLSEKQMEELNTRYGEPAKAKAKELRETMEKKFDEIAKEFEVRVEQLENELNTRFGRKTEGGATPSAGETPGEMPHGEHASTSTNEAAPASKPAKKAAKKSE